MARVAYCMNIVVGLEQGAIGEDELHVVVIIEHKIWVDVWPVVAKVRGAHVLHSLPMPNAVPRPLAKVLLPVAEAPRTTRKQYRSTLSAYCCFQGWRR